MANTHDPLLAEVLNLFSISLSPHAFWVLHSVTRKLAHLIEYGVFTCLIYRALLGNGDLRWRHTVAGWSVFLATVYSLTDKFHQSFIQGRGASLIDCAIDATGAALAMMLVYTLSVYRPKKTS